MNHTYLFREAEWVGKGTYFDNKGTTGPVEGVSRITHKENLWHLESSMKLIGMGEIEFTNNYEIKPFSSQNPKETDLMSFNPALGKFFGKMIIVEDSLLAYSHTEDHSRVAIEDIRQIDEKTYINHGALLVNNESVGSWMLTLTACEKKLRLVK